MNMVEQIATVPRDRTPSPLRVCFVQAYRAPDYIRGRSIRAALRASERVDLTEATNTSRGPARYWQAIRGLLQARRQHDPDIYVLGFRGHEIAWLVRWVTRGKPLVMDALMSPYASMSEESKFGWAGRMLSRVWRPYESAILHACDGVLTDTGSHASYYRSQFQLGDGHVLAIPVGAEEVPAETLPCRALHHDSPLRVLFYGSFLPLHGVDIILEAASQLTDLPIEFRFIGGTRAQAERLQQRCRLLGISRYSHTRWVAFEKIISDEIPDATLCLGGPFGGTPQARRVITGKTSQCMALGQATIVGRIPEQHGFIDRHNCLLVEQGDARSLAAAIRWAHAHRDALADIGERGRELYRQRLSRASIRDALVPFLEQLAARVEPA